MKCFLLDNLTEKKLSELFAVSDSSKFLSFPLVKMPLLDVLDQASSRDHLSNQAWHIRSTFFLFFPSFRIFPWFWSGVSE